MFDKVGSIRPVHVFLFVTEIPNGVSVCEDVKFFFPERIFIESKANVVYDFAVKN